MNTSVQNKKIIEVLSALIEKRTKKKHIDNFPISIITSKHLELINMDYFEFSRISLDLQKYKYILHITEEEFYDMKEKVLKEIEEGIEKRLKNKTTTPEIIYKNSKKILEFFGIRYTKEELEKIDDVEKTESFKTIITNRVEEELLKSKKLGIYKVKKDLHKLKRYLENGRDFYNLEKEWVDFNLDTQTLIIGQEIISLKHNPPLKGQYLLEYILKNGSKNKYPIDDLRDNNVIPDANNRTYYDAIKNLNTRITKESKRKIIKFMEKSGDYIYIRDKYTM